MILWWCGLLRLETAASTLSWQLRNPLPPAHSVNAVAVHDGTWVAVGAKGIVLSSRDGMTWGGPPSGSVEDLHGVVWGGGRFVAVGSRGEVILSPDGLAWTRTTAGVADTLRGVTQDGRRFTAVGEGGVVVSSEDGHRWDREAFIPGETLTGITALNTRWIVVSQGGAVYSGGPGQVWTRLRSDPAVRWSAITQANGMALAVGTGGTVAISMDGSVWEVLWTGYFVDLTAVAPRGDGFVAVGEDGAVLASRDGRTWVNQSPVDVDSRLVAVAAGNAAAVALGQFDGVLSADADGRWRRRGPLGFSDTLAAVAHGPGGFVAVGDRGAIARSPDGLVWTRGDTGTGVALRGITWGLGLFVTVGDAGAILHSADGVRWSRSESGSRARLSHVLFDGTRFLAVGGEFVAGRDVSVILGSEDGIAWRTVRSEPGPWLNSLLRSPAGYIAVGNTGTVLWSADGATWTPQPTASTTDLLGVAYGNGVHVAVGGKYFDTSSPILISTNGRDWRTTNPRSDNGSLVKILFVEGRFVAAGGGTIGRGHFNRSFTSLFESVDGVQWEPSGSIATTDWLAGITDGGGSLVAVGFNGLVLQSSPVVAIANANALVRGSGVSGGGTGIPVLAAPTARTAQPEAWRLPVPLLDRSGRIEFPVPAGTGVYWVLFRGRSVDRIQDPVALSFDGNSLMDPAPPREAGFYRAARVSLENPIDSDTDGLDDLFEGRRARYLNPLDSADALRPADGAYALHDVAAFNANAVREDLPGALGVRQVKFLVAGVDTAFPLVYFMNSVNHPLHAPFAFDVLGWRMSLAEFDIQTYFSDTRRRNVAGSVVAYDAYGSGERSDPPGIYAVEFWPADPVKFEFVSKTIKAIRERMPWVGDRLVYHPTGVSQEELFASEAARYEAAGIRVIRSEALFGSLSYNPIQTGFAFGVLRLLEPGALPDPRDIVVLNETPERLGRQAGILTGVPQTPLSHFGLLARQNNTPSAYLKDPAKDPRLAPFFGQLVRLEIFPEGFEVRPATPQERLAWEETLRPSQERAPARDLSERRVRPLAQIGSRDAVRFGAKAANVGELLKLLPVGIVPDGFAVPFSFYDEFMRTHGLYEELRVAQQTPGFDDSVEVRSTVLARFRERIETSARLPDWMLQALEEARQQFPPGTRIRCRSSANTEDLPGFTGAGLHDSFTHRPDEGVLANTVRQVWASLWTLRAFDEREFQRISHTSSAMGVLLHPSFRNEQANGVAVTRNLYDADWPGFYVNAQVGEDLVTNPEAGSIPEEFLVSAIGQFGEYERQYVRRSNRTPPGGRVLSDLQVSQLAPLLERIQAHFRIVYGQEDNPAFAMELEFKITETGELNIKQARPWLR